jgi:hypothetical protein
MMKIFNSNFLSTIILALLLATTLVEGEVAISNTFYKDDAMINEDLGLQNMIYQNNIFIDRDKVSSIANGRSIDNSKTSQFVFNALASNPVGPAKINIKIDGKNLGVSNSKVLEANNCGIWINYGLESGRVKASYSTPINDANEEIALNNLIYTQTIGLSPQELISISTGVATGNAYLDHELTMSHKDIWVKTEDHLDVISLNNAPRQSRFSAFAFGDENQAISHVDIMTLPSNSLIGTLSMTGTSTSLLPKSFSVTIKPISQTTSTNINMNEYVQAIISSYLNSLPDQNIKDKVKTDLSKIDFSSWDSSSPNDGAEGGIGQELYIHYAI